MSVKMKRRLFVLRPYLTVLALNFFALPFLMGDSGTAMVLMLFVMPQVALLCSVVYGLRQGFDPWFPVITALLFAVSIPIFYNFSAWVYILLYAAVTLAGSGLGALLKRRRRRRES